MGQVQERGRVAVVGGWRWWEGGGGGWVAVVGGWVGTVGGVKHPEQQQRVVVAAVPHAKVEGARLRV